MTASQPVTRNGNKPIHAGRQGVNEALNVYRPAYLAAVDQIIRPTARFLPLQDGAGFIRPEVNFIAQPAWLTGTKHSRKGGGRG